MEQINYQTLLKTAGVAGKVVKLTTVEGVPLEDKNYFARHFCEELTYLWNDVKKKWIPHRITSKLPWHIRHLIRNRELLIAPDASQTTIETLRGFEVKLVRKEESCGPSSQPVKGQELSTQKPDAQSAPSTPTETSGEPSHGLF